MKNIIMINGKKRAGKDFISDIILETTDYKKHTIAKYLKSVIAEVVGIPVNELDLLKNEERSLLMRSEMFFKNLDRELENVSKNINKTYHSYDQSDILSRLKVSSNDNLIEVDARIVLQELAHIFKELFGDDSIWINMLINDIKDLNDDIIISDFRFPFEYKEIQRSFRTTHNTSTLKIIGKNYNEFDEKYDLHPSERALDNFSFNYHFNNTIWNMDSIYSQVGALIKELNK